MHDCDIIAPASLVNENQDDGEICEEKDRRVNRGELQDVVQTRVQGNPIEGQPDDVEVDRQAVIIHLKEPNTCVANKWEEEGQADVDHRNDPLNSAVSHSHFPVQFLLLHRLSVDELLNEYF